MSLIPSFFKHSVLYFVLALRDEITALLVNLTLTDEEPFLQEISGMSVYEAFAVSVAGTSPGHVQKHPGR